jgi:hypothetical protein
MPGSATPRRWRAFVDQTATAPDGRAMLRELAVATMMVLATVAIHGFGLAVMGHILRSEAREERLGDIPPLSLRAFAFTMAIVLALFVLHGVEVWLYAFLYQLLGAVPDLHTAVYFSAITYGAIGFSDAAILNHWRLVAAIEGLNGVILLGWSTAFFVTIVGRMGRRR